MTLYAHITGWGMAVPRTVLTNEDLARRVATSDEQIVARTGIRQRSIADPQESTATLAARAAMRALAITKLRPRDLDLIIVATSSPDHPFPATACLVQDTLGAVNAGAFDLSAGSTGFLYALDLATTAIRSGSVRHVVVIGAETLSRLVDWEDPATCVLFGDGAGAVVLQRAERPGGVLASSLHSDGSGAELFSIPAGGSRLPATMETVLENQHTIHMSERELLPFAARSMTSAAREALQRAGLRVEDMALFIPHQSNLRILEAMTRSLHLPSQRMMVNVDRYGDTSTASIPIALCEALDQGRIVAGDHLVLAASGAGLSWGAQVIRWTAPAPSQPPAHRRLLRLATFLAHVRSLLRRLWRRIQSWLWRD